MKKVVFFIGLLGVLGACLYFIMKDDETETNHVSELEMHCAAGLQRPVKAIAQQYEKEYGVKVKLNFGGSGQLLAKLEVAGGDLYLPADKSYTQKAKSHGLVAETLPVSRLTAGLIVAKGNPKNIKQLSDLTRPDLRVALAARSAAVGKFTHKVLEQAGILKAIEAGSVSKVGTVNEVALQVEVGAADVGVVWDCLMPQFKHCDFVHVPEFDKKKKLAAVGILTQSMHPTAALKFARYLTAKDKGAKIFKSYGYDALEGDRWAEKPEILLFSGSMLRPAIQSQLKAFEAREGCSITVKYAGCGELVALMKAGDEPDFYASCDVSFMDMVVDKFRKPEVVSGNKIVILVAKGNPHKIKSLRDLSQPGLKLGIADRKRSALGALTYKLLASAGLLQAIESSANVQILAAKGDDLVNQMQTGALDAALLYRSNAMASSSIMKHCDIIEIDNKLAYAKQPIAIAKKTDYPLLLSRLSDHLTNQKGKESFLKYGFFWYKDQSQEPEK